MNERASEGGLFETRFAYRHTVRLTMTAAFPAHLQLIRRAAMRNVLLLLLLIANFLRAAFVYLLITKRVANPEAGRCGSFRAVLHPRNRPCNSACGVHYKALKRGPELEWPQRRWQLRARIRAEPGSDFAVVLTWAHGHQKTKTANKVVIGLYLYLDFCLLKPPRVS